MKRMVCFILSVAVLLLCMASCKGWFAEEDVDLAALVEKEIAELPTPAYLGKNEAFGIAVQQAEENYSKLSNEEKSRVGNYDRLLVARELYNFIWIQSHAYENAKMGVLNKLDDPNAVWTLEPHIYLYKCEEAIYTLVILDYTLLNSDGEYDTHTKRSYYLFLPDKEGVGYDGGTELDYSTYQQGVEGTTYYRRPEWN